jgi:hypothetical protein
MHLVAELFNQETQDVGTVSVVIDDENPNIPIGRRHRLHSFRQPTALVMPKSQVINAAPCASSRLVRNGRQDFLYLLETGGLDQMVIEPCFLGALTV